jgi:hypothetical protein
VSAEDTPRKPRLTITQRDVLEDIRQTGKPDGGHGYAIHTQRTVTSLLERGLIRFIPLHGWEVIDD